MSWRLRAGGVHQRPEQVEDRAQFKPLPDGGGMAHGRVMRGRPEEGDAGLFETNG